MSEMFHVASALGAASLTFFERTPPTPSLPLERFKVRLTDLELSAVVRVYVGPAGPTPAAMFSQMAVNWRGWQGAVTWESSEGELMLRSTQDRTGHVLLHVAMESGPIENDWSVEATIATEAGQLEALARQAALFFGTTRDSQAG